MKIKLQKTSVLLALCLTIGVFVNAQNISKDNLSKHVHTLASDEMRGRDYFTNELDNAANYIKQQLKDMGLLPMDYDIKVSEYLDYYEELSKTDTTIDYTSLLEDSENTKDKTFKNFYVVLKGNNPAEDTLYTLLNVDYNGAGVDTIKNYQVIKNSANYQASGCAAALEIARYFVKNPTLLNKNLIIMFQATPSLYYDIEYFTHKTNLKKIEVIFGMDNLGYIDEEKGSGQYTYTVSNRIKDASKILQPVLLQDVDLSTTADYNEYYKYPTIYVNGDVMDYYRDNPDSLNYDLMTQITVQMIKVITAFDKADVEILPQTTLGDLNLFDDDLLELLGGRNKSYFGLNLMIGSNKHYYSSDKYMTGKAAMSYSAGLFFKYQMSRSFALRLDANYERAYANRHDGRFKSDVLSVPLTFMLTAGTYGFEFYCGVGGYFDYNLSAKLNNESVDWDVFNRYEWGRQYMIGMSFGHFMIAYYQKIGSSNMMNTDIDGKGKIKNRNQYFTIGWHF